MKKNNKQIAIYQAPSGAVEVRLDINKETIFLSQQQIGELFNVQKSAISKHAKNIFDTGELDKKSTVSILETVQTEGKREIIRKIEYYNLDLILSIGYRVNSVNATKFRQWATKTLRQHIVRGYTINEKRLLEAQNRFRELQEAVLFIQKQSKKELLSASPSPQWSAKQKKTFSMNYLTLMFFAQRFMNLISFLKTSGYFIIFNRYMRGRTLDFLQTWPRGKVNFFLTQPF